MDWRDWLTQIMQWLQQDHVRHYYWLALTAFFCLWIGSILQSHWATWRDQRKGRSVLGRGRRMERKAAKLLKACGYHVLDDKPKLTMMLRIEGEAVKFDITPDFLVEKDGTQYVVEVKYWQGANPAIHNANIRRQVIEYIAASGLPCLLLEMPEGFVTCVDADLDYLA